MVGTMFDNSTFSCELPTRPATFSDRTVSPCDTLSTSPPPLRRISSANFEKASTSCLTSRFSRPQPFRDDRSSLPSTPVTLKDEELLIVDDRRSASAPASPLLLPRLPQISRQMQRQINIQLLSAQSQLTAICAFLEEKASSGKQCEIRAPTPLLSPPPWELTETSTSPPNPEATASSAPSSPAIGVLPALLAPSTPEELGPDIPLEVDEGFHDGDDEELDMEAMLRSFRRAQDRPDLRRLGYSAATVVYSRPRMRKKISRRKREDEIV